MGFLQNLCQYKREINYFGKSFVKQELYGTCKRMKISSVGSGTTSNQVSLDRVLTVHEFGIHEELSKLETNVKP